MARGGFLRFSDPSLLILVSLAGGPKHGYAMMEDIRDFAGVSLEPGTLYGAIARLEERGLIAACETQDRRQPYELTHAGRAWLEARIRMFDRISETTKRRMALRAGWGHGV